MNKSIYKKASDELKNLCDGSRRFTMSEPVQDSDTDVVMDNALEMARLLAEALIEYKEETENLTAKRTLLAEAMGIAEAFLSPDYKATRMRFALDYSTGQIFFGNTRIDYQQTPREMI